MRLAALLVPGHLSVAIALTAICGAPALADPKSDLFQPDVFGTENALKHRTGGLNDPGASECPEPASPLSFKAAVDIALCRYPATRQAWAAARQQAAALGSAESAWLPSISGTASEVHTFGGQIVDATGAVESGAQNTRDAAISLTWTLYDFGGRESRIKSARHLLDSAAGTLDRTVQQTVLNVVQGYYGVVAGDATLAAAGTTEGVTTKSLEIAKALQTGGVATLADVLQAQTAHDQAVLARIQADAAAKTAHGTFAVSIGYDASIFFKIETEAVPTEVPGLSARMNDLMAQAMEQRPDLAAARAQRDSAEADITTARSVGRPSISIQGGRSVSDTTGVPNQNYNQIGVYLTVPLFTGFTVAYGVRQAQAVLVQREAAVEQTRLAVTQDVWNSYYALDSANQQLTATANLTKTAQDNQDAALGRYQSGVGTILDVLTAQTAAANARQLRINAELGWKVARAQFALALGRLTSADPLLGDRSLP